MIELIGLTKSFNGHVVLDNVNLFVQEGEIFGVIGKSGAGKSTLLRTINLLERPDVGDVVIDGINLIPLPPKEIRHMRHKMSMIFQHFNLLESKTVYDNIALPMRIQGFSKQHIDEKMDELLPLVELESKKWAYPANLSGGQKQRVAIARALSTSPKILLCDEATSALDPQTTASILDLLQKINRVYGLTIVAITHEMEVVKRICHRLAVIDQGCIIETTGLVEALRNKESIARSLLFTQLSPSIPACILHHLSQEPNHKPVIRLLFEGSGATVPFISQTSRDLKLDINILLANIDRFGTETCGVLIAELFANEALLAEFISRCRQAELTVEILGYVKDDIL